MSSANKRLVALGVPADDIVSVSRAKSGTGIWVSALCAFAVKWHLLDGKALLIKLVYSIIPFRLPVLRSAINSAIPNWVVVV